MADYKDEENPFLALVDQPSQEDNPFLALTKKPEDENPFLKLVQQPPAEPSAPQAPSMADLLVRNVLMPGGPLGYKIIESMRGQRRADIAAAPQPLDVRGENIARAPESMTTKIKGVPVGVSFPGALDLMQRGQYLQTALAEPIYAKLADAPDNRDFKTIMKTAAQELIDPKMRLSHADLIDHYFPTFSKNNPVAAETLGLMLDIAGDFTTYVSLGADGIRIPLQGGMKKLEAIALSKEGRSIFDGMVTKGMPRAYAEDAMKTLFRESPDAKNLIDPGGVKFMGKTIVSEGKQAALDKALARLNDEGIWKDLQKLEAEKAAKPTKEMYMEMLKSHEHIKSGLIERSEAIRTLNKKASLLQGILQDPTKMNIYTKAKLEYNKKLLGLGQQLDLIRNQIDILQDAPEKLRSVSKDVNKSMDRIVGDIRTSLNEKASISNDLAEEFNQDWLKLEDKYSQRMAARVAEGAPATAKVADPLDKIFGKDGASEYRRLTQPDPVTGLGPSKSLDTQQKIMHMEAGLDPDQSDILEAFKKTYVPEVKPRVQAPLLVHGTPLHLEGAKPSAQTVPKPMTKTMSRSANQLDRLSSKIAELVTPGSEVQIPENIKANLKTLQTHIADALEAKKGVQRSLGSQVAGLERELRNMKMPQIPGWGRKEVLASQKIQQIMEQIPQLEFPEVLLNNMDPANPSGQIIEAMDNVRKNMELLKLNDENAAKLRELLHIREPRPLILPDEVVLDAPFRWIEKKGFGRQPRPARSALKFAQDSETAIHSFFKRYAHVPEAIAQKINDSVISVTNRGKDAYDFAMKLLDGLSNEEMEQVGRVAHVIDMKTEEQRQIRKAMGRYGTWNQPITQGTGKAVAEKDFGGHLTNSELLAVREQVMKGILEGPGKEELTKNSRNMVTVLMDEFDKRGQSYSKAGMVDHLVQNYAHRKYRNFDPEAILRYSRWKEAKLKGMPTNLSENEARLFANIFEAEKEGFQPEFNAALMLGSYISDVETSMVKRDLNKFILSFYGVDSFDELSKVAPKKTVDALNRELRYMGNSNYSLFEHSPIMLHGARFVDKVNGFFRLGATSANPAFAPKQFVGNFLQSGLEYGMKVFGIFSPQVFIPTAKIMLQDIGVNKLMGMERMGRLAEKLPWIGRAIENARAGKLISSMGEPLTHELMAEEVKRAGYMTAGSLAGDSRMARTVEKQIKMRGDLNHRWASNEGAKGAETLVRTMGNFLNWPEFMENYFKVANHINGRMLGHGEIEAGRKAYRAVYDYARGLAEAEQQIARRLGPFYTYPRKTADLILNTLVTNPGRIINTKKFTDHFMAAYGKFMAGEELTDRERRMMPDFLLEQPSAYTGKALVNDVVKSVFHTFNNFSPLDTWLLPETASAGKEGWQRTMEKTFLSAVLPLLKVPLELTLNRNFFTGQVIKDEDKPGRKLGKIDPDVMLTSMIAAMGGSQGGTLGAVAGGLFGAAGAAMGAEEVMKYVLGWENIDGTVYVTPWRAHVMTSAFPVLAKAIRLGNEEKTPGERTYELFTGVNIQKRDLLQDYTNHMKQMKRQIGEAKSDLKKRYAEEATRQQQLYEFAGLEDAKRKYEELIARYMADAQLPEE